MNIKPTFDPMPDRLLPPGPKPVQITPEIKEAYAFAFKDKNGDGTLCPDEFHKHGKAPTDRQLARFKRYDTNGDGKIDKQEFSAGRQWERFIKSIRNGWENFPLPGFKSKPPLYFDGVPEIDKKFFLAKNG